MLRPWMSTTAALPACHESTHTTSAALSIMNLMIRSYWLQWRRLMINISLNTVPLPYRRKPEVLGRMNWLATTMMYTLTHIIFVCQRIRNCGRLQVDWSIGQESWWYIAIKALLVDFAQTYIFFWVHTQNVHVAHYKLYAQPITCTCWPAQLMSYFDAEIPACISPS